MTAMRNPHFCCCLDFVANGGSRLGVGGGGLKRVLLEKLKIKKQKKEREPKDFDEI